MIKPRVSASTAAAAANETAQNVPVLIAVSAPEDAGGANGEGQQQKPKRYRRRPGRSVEGRGDAFDDADQHGAGEHAGEARHAAEHADRKDPPDVIAADRRLDRLDDDQQSAGHGGRRDRDAKGDALDTGGVRGHQLQGQPILRDRQDRPADKGAPEKELQHREHQQRDKTRDQHAQWQVDHAEMQGRTDIGRFDKAVVDAKDQDQGHFAYKQQAKEESEALNRLLAALLEGVEIDLVHRHADQKKYRRHDDADQDRIDAEIRIDQIGDKRPEHDKGRVGDVNDVEHAEGDRHAD